MRLVRSKAPWVWPHYLPLLPLPHQKHLAPLWLRYTPVSLVGLPHCPGLSLLLLHVPLPPSARHLLPLQHVRLLLPPPLLLAPLPLRPRKHNKLPWP